MNGAVAGAALSTVATFAQMALVLFATSEPTLIVMAPALAVGAVAAALYALAFTMRAFKSSAPVDLPPGRAVSIGAALGLAGAIAILLVGVAALKQWLGDAGIFVGATLAGFADTHSAAISVASLATSGKLAPQEAALPILAAMTSNAVTKIAMAIGAGSRAFAVRLVPGLVLSMGVAWVAAIMTVFQ